jgi:FKBP-type peptidyl-prolyl cis-trans isomerase (trigger factor)
LAKQEELSEEERAQKAAEIEQQRLQSIRRLYILDTINLEEKVTVDSNQVISEFMNTAQMFGLDPKQLIESPLGKSIYENIRQRNYEAQVLDRVTARVLGEPISTSEEVHDHNHAHDHDHNHG